MIDVMIRSEKIELLNRWETWVRQAGHTPLLTTSLAAAHAQLFRCHQVGRLPRVVVTSQPPIEQQAEIPRWDWLDALRQSAAPARLLLLARHPLIERSPRPNTVILADPDLSEEEFQAHLETLLRPAAGRP